MKKTWILFVFLFIGVCHAGWFQPYSFNSSGIACDRNFYAENYKDSGAGGGVMHMRMQLPNGTYSNELMCIALAGGTQVTVTSWRRLDGTFRVNATWNDGTTCEENMTWPGGEPCPANTTSCIAHQVAENVSGPFGLNGSDRDYTNMGQSLCGDVFLSQVNFRDAVKMNVTFIAHNLTATQTYGCTVTATTENGGEAVENFSLTAYNANATVTFFAVSDIPNATMVFGAATCVRNDGAALAIYKEGKSPWNANEGIGSSWVWAYVPEHYVMRSINLEHDYTMLPSATYDEEVALIHTNTTFGFRIVSLYSLVDVPIQGMRVNITDLPEQCEAPVQSFINLRPDLSFGTPAVPAQDGAATFFHPITNPIAYNLGTFFSVICESPANVTVQVETFGTNDPNEFNPTWLKTNSTLVIPFESAGCVIDDVQQWNDSSGLIEVTAQVKQGMTGRPINATCNLTMTKTGGVNFTDSNRGTQYIYRHDGSPWLSFVNTGSTGVAYDASDPFFDRIDVSCTQATFDYVPGTNGTNGTGEDCTVSGGTETTYGNYTVRTFTSNGTFSTNCTNLSVSVLVVGGGGGGGWRMGGGGGGGGFIYWDGNYTATGNISVVVGAGGAGSPNGNNTLTPNGENSSFGTLVAVGGGGGGTESEKLARAGGSGGGGYGWANSANWTGGLGTAGQGYDGGDGCANGATYANGGGGGGAGTVGGDAGCATYPTAPLTPGGLGMNCSIRNGTSVNYSADGNGSYYNIGGATSQGVAGAANTGNGGGGSGGESNSGAAGGSGIVIVRYLTADLVYTPGENGTNESWNATPFGESCAASKTFAAFGKYYNVGRCPVLLHCLKEGIVRSEAQDYVIPFKQGEYHTDEVTTRCHVVALAQMISNTAPICGSSVYLYTGLNNENTDWFDWLSTWSAIDPGTSDNTIQGILVSSTALLNGSACSQPSDTVLPAISGGSYYFKSEYKQYSGDSCMPVPIFEKDNLVESTVRLGEDIHLEGDLIYRTFYMTEDLMPLYAAPYEDFKISDATLRSVDVENRTWAEFGDNLVAELTMNCTSCMDPIFKCYIGKINMGTLDATYTQLRSNYSAVSSLVANGTKWQYFILDIPTTADHFNNKTEGQIAWCDVEIRRSGGESIQRTTNGLEIRLPDKTPGEEKSERLLNDVFGMAGDAWGWIMGGILSVFTSNPVMFFLAIMMFIISMPLIIALLVLSRNG